LFLARRCSCSKSPWNSGVTCWHYAVRTTTAARQRHLANFERTWATARGYCCSWGRVPAGRTRPGCHGRRLTPGPEGPHQGTGRLPGGHRRHARQLAAGTSPTTAADQPHITRHTVQPF